MTGKDTLNRFTTPEQPAPMQTSTPPAAERRCLTKQEVFRILYGTRVVYRSQTMRRFFTPDRLKRVGLSPEEYRSIRAFSPDASAAIWQELEKLNFIR
mgnify:CR=1 FL=1